MPNGFRVFCSLIRALVILIGSRDTAVESVPHPLHPTTRKPRVLGAAGFGLTKARPRVRDGS
jgi:hypothetical protein